MTPEHYQKLAAAGLNVEQIGVVMQILAESEAASKAADEARKAGARERVQRWRDKQKEGVTLPKHNGNATVPLTRGEITSSKEEVSGKEKKEESAPAVRGISDFRDVLREPLGSERLEAFIICRRAKKGGFSGHAARLFLADAATVSMTPADAADMCISRNWITVKPEYLRDKRPGATSPPDKPQPAETVGSLSRKQLFTPRNDSNAPGHSAGRVDESGPRRLEARSGDARTFAITGDILGSF